LAEDLLFGRLVGGGHVLIRAEDGELTLDIEEVERV